MKTTITIAVVGALAALTSCRGDEPQVEPATGATSTASSGGAGGQGVEGGAGPSTSAGGGGSAGHLPTPFVPYFADDFESYPNGEKLSPLPPYDAAGRTTASDEQVYRGTMAAKMEIREGDGGGFGNWGFIIPISPALPKGHEIWARMRVYWPASFEFSATPWMKFFRLHARKADGSNDGYNDLYVDEADSTTSVLRTIKEIHDVWEVYDGPPIARETWEAYEMYLFIDDVPVDDGGSARVRIWRDDELIFDRTDVPTISEARGDIDGFFVFTYWNNENPPDNHCYMDDLIIATDADPPTNVDANGNPFIGDYTW